MTIFEDSLNQKLSVAVNPGGSSVSVAVDGETRQASSCSGLAGKRDHTGGNWAIVSLSLIATDDEFYYELYCDESLLASGTRNKKLDFPLTDFRIGEGFSGLLREFKLFKLAMGGETFTKQTASKASHPSALLFVSLWIVLRSWLPCLCSLSHALLPVLCLQQRGMLCLHHRCHSHWRYLCL